MVLDFDHLGIVTVGQVLTDPDRYVDETLCDPLEGAAYGRDKAKVLRDRRNLLQLVIYSFAHGGWFYRLCHNAPPSATRSMRPPKNTSSTY